MKKYNVLVTAVGSASVGEQLIKALRHSALPLHITAGDCSSTTFGSFLGDNTCLLPPASHAEYIETLLAYCVEHEICAVFPGSEAELPVLARNADVFSSRGVYVAVQPERILQLCLDKCSLFDTLHERGVRVPRYQRIRHLEQISAVVYPVVLKPSRGTGGSADVYIAQNSEELELFARYLFKSRGEFMIQEYVGTAEEEYTVGVLSDGYGRFLGSIALHRTLAPAISRRLRVPNYTGRNELGAYLVVSSGVSQGHIGDYADVCRQCVTIADTLGSCGPMNLQCRFVDGVVCLFEINPRFSGTSYMRALAGFNEAELLFRRHVLREELPSRISVAEKTILRTLQEIVV